MAKKMKFTQSTNDLVVGEFYYFLETEDYEIQIRRFESGDIIFDDDSITEEDPWRGDKFEMMYM